MAKQSVVSIQVGHNDLEFKAVQDLAREVDGIINVSGTGPKFNCGNIAVIREVSPVNPRADFDAARAEVVEVFNKHKNFAVAEIPKVTEGASATTFIVGICAYDFD